MNPAPTPPAAPSAALQEAFEAQRKRNAILMGVLLAIGLMGAILGGLFASGILGRGASTPPSHELKAVGVSKPPENLQVRGQTESNGLQKVADRPVMPDDVRAWLLHLEKCEQMKIEISLRQQAEMVKFGAMASVLGAGIGEMDPYDQSEGEGTPPEQVTKGKFLDLKPEWENLIGFFQSVPPPAECKPLADDFYRALSEIPGMTGDVVDVMNMVNQDPSAALQKANALKSKSYSDIDRYFARADERLSAICAKYEERKWFNIKSDVVGGGSLGKFGSGSFGGP